MTQPVTISVFVCLLCAAGCRTAPEPDPNSNSTGRTNTVLGIEGSRFTLNGRPTFLLGLSYFAALAAHAGIEVELAVGTVPFSPIGHPAA